MSDPRRTLREGAKQLGKLHKDLHPPTFSRRSYSDKVFARASLGEDVEVELWFLAEHFLLAWHDWHGVLERYPRYFGEPEKEFPARWRQLDGDCSLLANRLLREHALGELVAKHWVTTGVSGGERHDEPPTVRDLFHVVVQNHRRWVLMKDAETGWLASNDLPDAPSEQALVEDESWLRCEQLAVDLNTKTFAICQEWLAVVAGDLRFHLRHYCHANLLVSWLVDDLRPGDGRGDGDGDGRGDGRGSGDGRGDGDGNGRGDGRGDGWQRASHRGLGRSALFQLLTEKNVDPNLEEYVRRFDNPDIRGAAGRVVERITHAIAEIGYDEFIEDVGSADFRGGPDSLVGASAINLLPSNRRGPGQPLLLALSRGDKKAVGFPNVMKQVREHLIRCSETKAVIVVCDHWRPGILDDHIGDLRAHHDKNGVQFLFLMVGTPGNRLSPVAVDVEVAA